MYKEIFEDEGFWRKLPAFCVDLTRRSTGLFAYLQVEGKELQRATQGLQIVSSLPSGFWKVKYFPWTRSEPCKIELALLDPVQGPPAGKKVPEQKQQGVYFLVETDSQT